MSGGTGSKPVRIAVLGANGRVGRQVIGRILADPNATLVAAIGRYASASIGVDAGVLAGCEPADILIRELGPDCFADAEVVVDFSLPAALVDALPHLGRCALVSGTTGLSAQQQASVAAVAGTHTVLQAANFSTGVTVLADLVARAARALPDADIEITEAHHRRKVDAPSGTALFLARAAAEARGVILEDVLDHGRHGHTGERARGRIGVHALRMGDVVGEHDVWFASDGDRVRLGHVATSRETFAVGALRAAKWCRGRPPGRYTMRDVLGITP